MGKIVWLASYPKSGNTWVRMLLNNYFSSDSHKRDLNSLDLSTYGGSSKSSYRAVTERDIDACTDAEIMALTPKAHAFIASKSASITFTKTHNLLSDYQGYPLITPKVTEGAIYIVRNPLDTAVSVADHFGLSMDKAVDFVNSPNGSTAPNETVVRQIFSSWANNVQSWSSANAAFPIWTVRYEDLHEAPAQCLTDILRFLGATVDKKNVIQAVRQSSFKALKSMEKRDGFTEKSQHSTSFFRSGKTGQWRQKLTTEQVDKIVRFNHVQMKRFGYLPK